MEMSARSANVVTGLTAAGTTLGTATAIANSADVSIVSTVASGTGVVVGPNAGVGSARTIRNDGVNMLSVYFQGLSGTVSGATCNGVSGATAFLIPPGQCATFRNSDGLSWTTQAFFPPAPLFPVSNTTLTAAQSGAKVYVDTSKTAYTVTLPDVANKGVSFEFINSSTTKTGAVTIASANGAVVSGVLIGAATIVACTASTNVLFAIGG